MENPREHWRHRVHPWTVVWTQGGARAYLVALVTEEGPRWVQALGPTGAILAGPLPWEEIAGVRASGPEDSWQFPPDQGKRWTVAELLVHLEARGLPGESAEESAGRLAGGLREHLAGG